VQSVNATRSSIHGAEAGLDINISDAISANAILNYTWGEETTETGLNQAADRIPPLSGRLLLRYDVDAAWTFEAWLTAAGAQQRLSNRDVRDVRMDPLGTPGWTILGLNASWTPGERWQVDFGADNLLDKRYRSHGSGIDAPGRNLSVRFQANW